MACQHRFRYESVTNADKVAAKATTYKSVWLNQTCSTSPSAERYQESSTGTGRRGPVGDVPHLQSGSTNERSGTHFVDVRISVTFN